MTKKLFSLQAKRRWADIPSILVKELEIEGSWKLGKKKQCWKMLVQFPVWWRVAWWFAVGFWSITSILQKEQTTRRGCRLRPLRCLSQFKSIFWRVLSISISRAQRIRNLIPGVTVLFIGQTCGLTRLLDA
jgi:hypothetical protein